MTKFIIEIQGTPAGVGMRATRDESGTILDNERAFATMIGRAIQMSAEAVRTQTGGAAAVDAQEIGDAILRSKGIQFEPKPKRTDERTS